MDILKEFNWDTIIVVILILLLLFWWWKREEKVRKESGEKGHIIGEGFQ